MSALSAFPIATRWPAAHPDRLQLYSCPTPNGVKVSIALEELGLAYEPHFINIGANETWTPEYLALNPNGKIPAIIDPDGPGAKPLALFESGAILVYLAEKTGKLIPADAAGRYQTLQWVMFQMGAIGPMFGQVGFFHKFAGKDFPDKRPLERYVAESKRLLGVLETRLTGRRLHHRRHLHARLGAQPDRLLRRGRAGRLRRLQARRRMAGARPGPPGGAAGPGDTQAAVNPTNRSFPRKRESRS
jgi:GST-like protein